MFLEFTLFCCQRFAYFYPRKKLSFLLNSKVFFWMNENKEMGWSTKLVFLFEFLRVVDLFFFHSHRPIWQVCFNRFTLWCTIWIFNTTYIIFPEYVFPRLFNNICYQKSFGLILVPSRSTGFPYQGSVALIGSTKINTGSHQILM